MTECRWKCSKDEFGDSQKEWRKDVSVGFGNGRLHGFVGRMAKPHLPEWSQKLSGWGVPAICVLAQPAGILMHAFKSEGHLPRRKPDTTENR